MSEIDEMIFKVSVELDDQDLAKARRELQAINREAKEVSKQLGLPSSASAKDALFKMHPPQKQVPTPKEVSEKSGTGQKGSPTLQNVDALTLLSKSEQHLSTIVDLMRKSTRGGRDGSGAGQPPAPPRPPRDDTKPPKPDGSGGGGNKALTAFAFIEIIKSVVSVFTAIKDKAIELLSDKFSRELDLHKLSEQTGYSVESLYKMEKAANLAGTSLKSLMDNAQNMQEEFMFGMDEKKAQMLLAMGINPIELLNESGNDPMKMQDLLFSKASEMTAGMPASMRASMIQKATGLTPEQQYGMRHKGDANVQEAAGRLSDLRGEFLPANEWREGFVKFNEATQRVQAAMDNALDKSIGQALTSIISDVTNIQAKAVTIVGELFNTAASSSVTPNQYAQRTDAESMFYGNKPSAQNAAIDRQSVAPTNGVVSSPSPTTPPKADPYKDIEAIYNKPAKKEKLRKTPEQWNQAYPGSPPPPFVDDPNKAQVKTAGR